MMYFEKSLERLALTFNARDMMVAKKDLVCATDKETAQKNLIEHPDFDIMPIVNNSDEIVAYCERDFGELKSIRSHVLVSESTNILDLVYILRNQKFCFVLVKNGIDGYIHFSDLNKTIVKLPYFLILENLEQCLTEKIRFLLHKDVLKEVLNPERTSDVKNRMKNMKTKRANLRWENLLSFNEILRFAKYFEIVKLDQSQIDVLSKVRNLICHADRPLIEKHENVKRLAEARQICTDLLNDLIAKDLFTQHSRRMQFASSTQIFLVGNF